VEAVEQARDAEREARAKAEARADRAEADAAAERTARARGRRKTPSSFASKVRRQGRRVRIGSGRSDGAGGAAAGE
jgi:hypothetical protein